jgi:two-component system osmolarity sensor histidine kinase EnvZ
VELPLHPFTALRRFMPKRLFIRSLIIIVAPVVLLQAIITYVFFERHWDLVTRRLSSSVAADIALLIQAGETVGGVSGVETFSDVAAETIGLEIEIIPNSDIPRQRQEPFFTILDSTIRRELEMQLTGYDFWFDTESEPSYVYIHVQLGADVLKVKVRRSRVYATNWHIFLVWMVVISVVLLAISIVFLRNQVRPIQRLADAANSFGKGHDVDDFKPSGATEVRSASAAFLDMRERIQRQINQRTEMLAGVSHDLRTPLTRLKLGLALLGERPEIEDMRRDLVDMEHMLDEYLAFARGEDGEIATETDIGDLLSEIADDARRQGAEIVVAPLDVMDLKLRRRAIKRCVSNLVENAVTYSNHIKLSAWRDGRAIKIAVDDDGPGIPPELRNDAFKPFNRLDDSRSLAHSGVGLGLAIARDVAQVHGGDIVLDSSDMGGLRAVVHLPL